MPVRGALVHVYGLGSSFLRFGAGWLAYHRQDSCMDPNNEIHNMLAIHFDNTILSATSHSTRDNRAAATVQGFQRRGAVTQDQALSMLFSRPQNKQKAFK